MKKTIIEGHESYTCQVVQINKLKPIKGADKIQVAIVNYQEIITSINTKVGDIMLYFPAGTKLDGNYCFNNNLYDLPEANKDKIKGYISHKRGVVKAISMKSTKSVGLLMPLSSLSYDFDQKEYESLQVGDEFHKLDNVSICEKYFVPKKQSATPGGKKVKKSESRIIDSQFSFLPKTNHLNKMLENIFPWDTIGIHYKKHGTSGIWAHIPVKRKLNWFDRLCQKIGLPVRDIEYDHIFSSRTVVRNGSFEEKGPGFYGENIWEIVSNEIKHLIPKNWTIYGEVLGYTPSGKAIQGKYDYGCEVGQHKLYVYRITVTNPDGTTIDLTDKQIEEFCELNDLNFKDTLFFYGRADEFFNENNIATKNVEQWREKFLEFLQANYLEGDCFMCKNKVVEEGIILRKEKLFGFEAYKLKSPTFIINESKAQEKDESNIEDES